MVFGFQGGVNKSMVFRSALGIMLLIRFHSFRQRIIANRCDNLPGMLRLVHNPTNQLILIRRIGFSRQYDDRFIDSSTISTSSNTV
jgi:hypothetical protein